MSSFLSVAAVVWGVAVEIVVVEFAVGKVAGTATVGRLFEAGKRVPVLVVAVVIAGTATEGTVGTTG